MLFNLFVVASFFLTSFKQFPLLSIIEPRYSECVTFFISSLFIVSVDIIFLYCSEKEFDLYCDFADRITYFNPFTFFERRTTSVAKKISAKYEWIKIISLIILLCFSLHFLHSGKCLATLSSFFFVLQTSFVSQATLMVYCL